ncbi:MAG: molybdopterin cofactor-binding domain-containing protein [Microscillaceae bacterium]|nr:molybdopterin cofactor-binding domain-containing protein [Microscillaceae bacterium]
MKELSTTSKIFKVNRRDFLKNTSLSVGGLMLGFQFSCTGESKPNWQQLPEGQTFKLNTYLSINERGDIILMAHRSEMGQGVRTTVPMMLAEELEADWSRVKIVQSEGDEETYGNQNTDGSFSIRMFYMPMRKAGATVRTMLERAAAEKWKVNPSECKAENHQVKHLPSGKTFHYGELAASAAKLPIPKEAEVKLKDPKNFKLIGKGVSIIDMDDIITGKATFGMDAKMEGMKIAMIQRCPVVGGEIKSFNEEEIAKMPGIKKVMQIKSSGFPAGFDKPLGGVVIVGDDTWSVIKARKALKVEWNYGANASYDSEAFLKSLNDKAKQKGTIRRENGKVEEAFQNADQIVEATYQLPHYAHSPMETPCALVHVKDNKCEIWAPTQHPQWAKGAVAGAIGLDVKNVKINITLLGGGFGRKSKPDFIVEAALISKESGFPIKLIWTREDDVQHDFYHALSVQHVRVALDKDKKVLGWNQRSLFQPIGGTADPNAKEPDTGELGLGYIDFPFAIPNLCLETNQAIPQIRIGWLRSVANIQHAFAIGSMIDEVAVARKVDPAQNLIDLLGDDRILDIKKDVKDFSNYGEKPEDYPWDIARLRKVIELVKEKSNWGKKLGKGRGQGITAHRSFLTYVACVVEVAIDEKGNISIPEVHYAVDCGVAVNPERIKSQFEGGAAFAVGIALKNQITVKEGKVVQGNFNNYEQARMTDAPKQVFVHLVESTEKPTGVGEPPVPPVIPALCNAVYAATGQRIRELPLRLS